MDAQTKQQVVESLKKATNILVTVNNNPSVDQLAACIGLTLLLNKLDKHATAVFSGQVPSTIEFLQPEKTIETNTDSLRDFIISLDKAKADKLRYKVEDQYVRIFITPYKTSISEKDLVFNQGEFNVEVILALGVSDQRQLDAAITAHGKILHDATVISVNAGNSKAPALGQVDWRDPSASSLSEMLVSISEAFGSNLLDGQMATAFLTGIVAETQRFSNAKTSPKAMTMAAQLMAAGANQQLIVSKLEPPKPAEPPPPPPEQPKTVDSPPSPKTEDKGTLSVKHEPAKPGTPTAPSQEVNINPNEISIDNEGTLLRAEELLKEQNGQKVVKPPEHNPPAPEASAPEAPAPASQAQQTPLPAPPQPPPPPPEPTLPPQPEVPDLPDKSGASPGSTPMPPPHAFLTKDDNRESAFAAGMETESDEPAVDPLAEEQNLSSGFLTRAKDVGSQPPSENNTVAPPPFPPPMNLGGGVVIPPPPVSSNNNAKPDEETI